MILLPYTPLSGLLGLAPLPGLFLLALGMIVVCYVIAAEVAKSIFYRRVAF